MGGKGAADAKVPWWGGAPRGCLLLGEACGSELVLSLGPVKGAPAGPCGYLLAVPRHTEQGVLWGPGDPHPSSRTTAWASGTSVPPEWPRVAPGPTQAFPVFLRHPPPPPECARARAATAAVPHRAGRDRLLGGEACHAGGGGRGAQAGAREGVAGRAMGGRKESAGATRDRRGGGGSRRARAEGSWRLRCSRRIACTQLGTRAAARSGQNRRCPLAKWEQPGVREVSE